MCAIIRTTWKAFRTVISRVEFCPISKGCRVSRHPSGVKDHPMNRIRKIYRVNLRQRKPYGMLYRSRLTGYLWRDAGVSWNTTPRHFCNVFLPGGSYNLFPSPVFPLCVYKVRLHDVENRKPAMAYSTFAAFADWRCSASGYRLAADRAVEKTQMWSTATIMWRVSS